MNLIKLINYTFKYYRTIKKNSKSLKEDCYDLPIILIKIVDYDCCALKFSPSVIKIYHLYPQV